MSEQPRYARRRFVDMWAMPSMHPSNIELLQQLRTADSHHFNTHMDIVGEVSEWEAKKNAWEKTHIVGMRTDVWRADADEKRGLLETLRRKRHSQLRRKVRRSGRLSAKQSAKLEAIAEEDAVMNMDADAIEKRRMVLKLFKTTTDRTRWCGTIEEITATEIHNSMGSGRTLLTLAVLLPRNDYVTYIQQNHRSFRIPALFTMGYVAEQRMWHLMIRRRWISIGADFDVTADGQPLGNVDGKLFSFGADSHINLADHPLSKDTQFVDLITLFAASVGYHDAMRRAIDRRVRAVENGESYRHLIEDEELRLRQNGRAAA